MMMCFCSLADTLFFVGKQRHFGETETPRCASYEYQKAIRNENSRSSRNQIALKRSFSAIKSDNRMLQRLAGAQRRHAETIKTNRTRRRSEKGALKA